MKRMNKKGQLAVVGIVFSLMIFLILFALFFAGWVNVWAQQMIVVNSLTGVEAFLVSNMNLWIVLGTLVGAIATLYYGGVS